MKIAIVGGGASALMCGGFLTKKGYQVDIFDGNEKAGKKLFITGKGRCNFTNACQNDEFLQKVVNGDKFLFSSLNAFNPYDTMAFFEDNGLEYKIERGGRVFPKSDKSSDVIKVLLNHCKDCTFHLNEKIVSVSKKQEFLVVSNRSKYFFDKVIVATGGKSYEATGSQGDGYKFAKIFGHNIILPKPALCPIVLCDEFVPKIQGLSLKNVALKVCADGKNFHEFGEMLFTDKGITGPIVLSLSSKINTCKKVELAIDFKPALLEEKLEERILRDFEEAKNKNIANLLKGLLPMNLIDIFLSKCGISKDKKINLISFSERKTLVSKMKNFELSFKELYPINCSIITSGGVDLKQINPKTMESKIVEGLYFIGEVLDIDALTGGYNLQIAFSTAFACAENL